MRHRKAGVKLNRTASHRNAMFRNMVTSLLKYERIQTTDTKAKEIRRWADHVITLAKRGDLHARRQVLSIVREKDVVHKLFEGASERFGALKGGYTRIVKVGRRQGDAAQMSIIELMGPAEGKPRRRRKKKKKSTPETAATAPQQTAASGGPVEQKLEKNQGDVVGQKSGQEAADVPDSGVKTVDAMEKQDHAAVEPSREDAVDEVATEAQTDDGSKLSRVVAEPSGEKDEVTEKKV